MADMHMLAVGQRYLPEGKTLPGGAQYNYRGGAHELLLVFNQPTRKEILAVRAEPCAFAFYAEGDQIIFLYHFGAGIPWSDTPYSIHRLDPAERIVPPPEEADIAAGEEPHALLTVILVRRETMVVEALRAVTFSPAFTVALHAAIRRQAELPYDRLIYERNLTALYRRHPTTTDLLAAAQSRTTGGR